jgi:hypothetical protein
MKPRKLKTIITILAVVLLAFCFGFFIKKYTIEGFDTVNKNEELFENAPMFLINLDRRSDRLSTTTALLNETGYAPIKRIRATDGSAEWETLKAVVKDDAMQSIYDGRRTEHHQLSKGAVGCYISHLNLWKQLLGSQHEVFIIFEDDTLPTLTKTELGVYLSRVPDDWDIILFGAEYGTECIKVNDHVCRAKRFYCLHAYAIRKKAARYLVPRALPIEQQIDSWMSDIAEKGDIIVYFLPDSNWMQNIDIKATDIQTPITLAQS